MEKWKNRKDFSFSTYMFIIGYGKVEEWKIIISLFNWEEKWEDLK